MQFNGLNGVNRQPSKKGNFQVPPTVKKQLLLAVRRFEGLLNLTVSAIYHPAVHLSLFH